MYVCMYVECHRVGAHGGSGAALRTPASLTAAAHQSTSFDHFVWQCNDEFGCLYSDEDDNERGRRMKELHKPADPLAAMRVFPAVNTGTLNMIKKKEKMNTRIKGVLKADTVCKCPSPKCRGGFKKGHDSQGESPRCVLSATKAFVAAAALGWGCEYADVAHPPSRHCPATSTRRKSDLN